MPQEHTLTVTEDLEFLREFAEQLLTVADDPGDRTTAELAMGGAHLLEDILSELISRAVEREGLLDEED